MLEDKVALYIAIGKIPTDSWPCVMNVEGDWGDRTQCRRRRASKRGQEGAHPGTGLTVDGVSCNQRNEESRACGVRGLQGDSRRGLN